MVSAKHLELEPILSYYATPHIAFGIVTSNRNPLSEELIETFAYDRQAPIQLAIAGDSRSDDMTTRLIVVRGSILSGQDSADGPIAFFDPEQLLVSEQQIADASQFCESKGLPSFADAQWVLYHDIM